MVSKITQPLCRFKDTVEKIRRFAITDGALSIPPSMTENTYSKYRLSLIHSSDSTSNCDIFNIRYHDDHVKRLSLKFLPVYHSSSQSVVAFWLIQNLISMNTSFRVSCEEVSNRLFPFVNLFLIWTQ